MSAYKSQVFIIIDINIPCLSKMLYDKNEMNNTLNLINKIFLVFCRVILFGNQSVPCYLGIHITVNNINTNK